MAQAPVPEGTPPYAHDARPPKDLLVSEPLERPPQPTDPPQEGHHRQRPPPSRALAAKQLAPGGPPLPTRLPQPGSTKGVVIALAIIAGWTAVYVHALLRVKLGGPQGSSPLHIAATFLALEYLYTGLFVNGHEAIHGAIAPTHRPLNDLLGALSHALFAWFPYSRMRALHWAHHNHTGVVGGDPDFHGGDPAPWRWFLHMMATYVSVGQLAKAGGDIGVTLALGVPPGNLLLFKVAAPVLSSVRMFYFGTYEPHHPPPNSPHQQMPWQSSRSTSCSRFVSMLRCYNFDYHWEHHRWPHAPWWQLGDYKRLVGEGKIAAL